MSRLWWIPVSLALVTQRNPYRPFIVLGSSMNPALEDGQIVVCEKPSYTSQFYRGGLVLLQHPRDSRMVLEYFCVTN